MVGEILISRIEEKISLDGKNQQILQMLIDDSRTTISKISHKLKLSKPAILQRINQMQNKKIILKYISYFNLISAGYKFYAIFLETNKEREPEYSQKLSSNKFTSAVVQLASEFNLIWMVFCKDNEHLNEIISEVTETIEIKNMRIFPIIENYFDSYKLFENTKKVLEKPKSKRINLDKKDAKILNILKDNSRETLVNIAKECGLTAEAVKQRIKRLKENGTILSFFTNFDIFRFGFNPYTILIKTNRQNQKEILKFIREHRNSNGQYVIDSEYDLMCILVIKEISELRNFIDELNSKFKEQILNYQTYLLTNQISNDFFPKGIYEDILKK